MEVSLDKSTRMTSPDTALKRGVPQKPHAALIRDRGADQEQEDGKSDIRIRIVWRKQDEVGNELITFPVS